MKVNLKYIFFIIILIINCYNHGFAQKPIRTGPTTNQEINKALSVLTINLNNVQAHENYIYKMGLENPLLLRQYQAWMKKYPKNLNIPLAIGTAYYNAEMPQAKDFLLNAATIDPINAKIWSMLSGDAFNRGQTDLSNRYIEKATLANPLDASYAFGYLMSFKDEATDEYKQKVFDFAKRFPTDERGAQALYWLGTDATDVNKKINYMEKLRNLYPPKKFNWSASGMIGLADAYLQTDLEKALVLINSMGEEKDWQLRRQVAKSLIEASKLEQLKDFTGAINELNQLELPKFNYVDNFIILKKASLLDSAGNTKLAYESICEKFAKLPTDELYTALKVYGKKIGKNKEKITKDIQVIRYSKAMAAYPFKLGLYSSRDSLNLIDLKGKVILLTFWFPGCAPCKAEFPHFQAVINNFKPENVAYIGINVLPEQDSYVTPYMKNTGYSFIPLRGSQQFASKNYEVQSEPQNFLIDKKGNIIFKDFRIDQKNRRTLELMIASLL